MKIILYFFSAPKAEPVKAVKTSAAIKNTATAGATILYLESMVHPPF